MESQEKRKASGIVVEEGEDNDVEEEKANDVAVAWDLPAFKVGEAVSAKGDATERSELG